MASNLLSSRSDLLDGRSFRFRLHPAQHAPSKWPVASSRLSRFDEKVSNPGSKGSGYPGSFITLVG
eukprot:jgi/Pico_ML_1/55385/g1077.t1